MPFITDDLEKHRQMIMSGMLSDARTGGMTTPHEVPSGSTQPFFGSSFGNVLRSAYGSSMEGKIASIFAPAARAGFESLKKKSPIYQAFTTPNTPEGRLAYFKNLTSPENLMNFAMMAGPVQDVSGSLPAMLAEHTRYHTEDLGTASEDKLSEGHVDLVNNIAKSLGLDKPVLPEDRVDVLREGYRLFPETAAGFPTVTRGAPVVPLQNLPPIAERTPEMQAAAWRVEQGKNFNQADQWDMFKRGVSDKLRLLSVPDETLKQIRNLGPEDSTVETFSSHLFNKVKLGSDARTVVEAVANGVGETARAYGAISAGQDLPPDLTSPLSDLDKMLFQPVDGVPKVNVKVAKKLLEIGNAYAERANTPAESFKAYNFQTAAKALLSTRGVDVGEIAKSGDAEELIGAFKGGRIGKSIADEIMSLATDGTSERYESLFGAQGAVPAKAAMAPPSIHVGKPPVFGSHVTKKHVEDFLKGAAAAFGAGWLISKINTIMAEKSGQLAPRE